MSGLPNNLRLRPDLVIQTHDSTGDTWVVKDPISLRFFFFGSDEHFILQRLNGKKSTEDILEEFASERAPKRMTAARLHAFLHALWQNGLARSDSSAQGALLREREEEQHLRESLARWTSLLAIRLPGFNPDSWLERTYPSIRWCFSWWFLTLCSSLCCVSLFLAATEADALSLQWPRLQEFVSGRNVVWLVVALAVTKILHELAHAFTCKHFGGKCHELGMMFLVFTPCLYCNVSDAWMLRNRWQRIAISAAGILMEFFLASLALLLWRYTHPGPLNSICFNIMVVCGVGTLLFNGNPLLKYDGYYILSDLVRVPNLWQESRSCLCQIIASWYTTREPTPGKHSGSVLFLVGYALASLTYRLCLTFAIFFFLYRILHPNGLDVLLILGVLLLAANRLNYWVSVVPRLLNNPMTFKNAKKLALLSSVILCLTVLSAIFGLPIPYNVTAPAVLQPRDATRVYVATPGVLKWAISAGEHVVKGQEIGRLESDTLVNQRLRVASDLTRAKARVSTLQSRLHDDSEAAAQLLVAREILADLEEQSLLQEKECESLTLLAPRSGIIVEPPAVPTLPTEKRELPAFSGTPLSPDNSGCYLERGELFCLISTLEGFDAIALVDETEVTRVRLGQQARIQLENAPAETLAGEVIEIAELNTETAPVELAALHDVEIRRDMIGNRAPIRTMYQVRLKLVSKAKLPIVGARAVIKIRVDSQTLAERISRFVNQTFLSVPTK